jgi:phenylacetic acid degradation protein
MRVPPRSLVAGVPAKVLRTLSEAEIAWKHAGTLSYQELTRRSLASLRLVTPLHAVEADRPRLQPDAVKPLIAERRG